MIIMMKKHIYVYIYNISYSFNNKNWDQSKDPKIYVTNIIFYYPYQIDNSQDLNQFNCKFLFHFKIPNILNFTFFMKNY